MTSKNLRVLFVVNVPNFGTQQGGIFTYRQFLSLKKFKGINVSKIDLPIHNNKLVSYLKFAMQIRKMSNNYDILHAHHSYSIILGWLFKKKKSKLIGTFLSDRENNFRFKIKWVNKLFFYFTQMICDHAIVKNDQSIIWPNKCLVLGNPVNTEKFQIKDNLWCKKKIGVSEENVIGIVISGDLNRPEKNLSEYHNIMSTLKGEYSPLVINNINPDDMCDYINCCEFIIVTSKFEGSPNAVKEALACGVPVISRDVGDVKKLLLGLNCCHVYTDPNEINIKLLKELRGNVERDLLRKQVSDFYGTEAEVAAKLIKIYQEIT